MQETEARLEQRKASLNLSAILRIFQHRSTLLALLIIVIGFGLSNLTPYFLTQRNLTFIATGMTYDLLLAIGMTIVLILGGIDLSVGSILGLTGVVTTMMLQDGLSIPVSIAIGLGVAVLCGATNGFIVAYLKIAPFIVTLGMMAIARGIATVLTSGYFVSGLPKPYLEIGQGKFQDIPYMVFFGIGVTVLLAFLLQNWKPLKEAFYIGTNPVAARLSGIRVGIIIMAGFTFSGLMAGFAAVFMTSRLAMGFFQFGLQMELKAIAAAVIGGASLTGGSGSIVGTFLAVLLLAIINNGFVLLKGSPNWQNVIMGAILVVAIIVDAYRRRREVRE